jgi:hypothetical protein|tara:strand:- start:144 stop:437 length:294 start_codon:yes stop_codon:yes gene_type:complete
MSEEIKFTEEELKSLGDLQQAYQRITNSYGQIALAKHNLEEQEAAVKSEFENTRKQEQNLLNSITEKYGPGQLNPQTGVFTPAPVEDSSQVQTETLE